MKRIVGACVVGALGALVFSGCAKENVVKKDESIVPPATTQAKQTVVKTAKDGADTSSMKQAADSAKQDVLKAGSPSQDHMTSALEKVYFNFDSYALSDQARQTLTKNAEYLRRNEATKLRIEGNCDERGSAEYNIALGEKRANAAMKYLVTMGIPADRLSTTSYGKEKSLDPGHDESAWSKNRRDDFTILTN